MKIVILEEVVTIINNCYYWLLNVCQCANVLWGLKVDKTDLSGGMRQKAVRKHIGKCRHK